MRIVNPSNESVMIGEAGKELGRAGRASIVLIDEAAFIEQPEAAEAALAEVSDVKFWLSTPNRPADFFCNKRHTAGIEVFSMRWKEHPYKNGWIAYDAEGQVVATGNGESPDPRTVGAKKILYPWYEAAKRRYSSPAKLAREVDIDYSAASDRLVFPSIWVQAAINMDLGDMGEIVECGGDLAGDGDNENIWTMRRGAAVIVQKKIVRPNPTQAARAFLMASESVGAGVFHYDVGGGYGGAVAGEHDPATNGGKKWEVKIHAVNGGGKCSGRKFGDKPAKELFTNLKAEMFWTVRERFRKSYELSIFRQGDAEGIDHDPTDCISIPDDPELIQQLSTVETVEVPSGKVQMESKLKMRDRSVKSPDKVDSLVYSFAPTPARSSTEATGSTVVSG
jgi:phage terminase large subunit